ncbi:MAG: hypothetical protein JWN00_1300 [Actinomycetia bacterium]|jgi:hypothetical protein|nr:hypothetical protein [Actinomycetes bacterium]
MPVTGPTGLTGFRSLATTRKADAVGLGSSFRKP